MSHIFGHSESQSQSSNKAFDRLSSVFDPTLTQGAAAGGQLASLLGLSGGGAQNQAFDNWRKSTGYQFGLDQGNQNIVGNAATQGLLNSGATAKALQTYGQNYADTQYGNYFNQLSNLLGQGLQAGQVISGAGNVSQSFGGGQGGGVGGIVGRGIGMLLGK